MPDMIERAILALRQAAEDYDGPAKHWKSQEQQVVSVLKAIREPTDEMVAATDKLYEFPLGSSTPSNSPEPETIFQVMIDTALKTEEKADVIQS